MEVPKAPDLSSCESLRTALTPGSIRTSGPPRNHLKTKAAELPRIAPSVVCRVRHSRRSMHLTGVPPKCMFRMTFSEC